MLTSQIILTALLLPFSYAAETILGVYILSRHGDRTAKLTPPANLTALGYREIFTTGTAYRNRYVASNATSRIYGLNPDLVKLSQLAVSAPVDGVLWSSAVGFMQGVYPPVGPQTAAQELKDKTIVEAPLNGYQIIPVSVVGSGANSENSAWLQGSTNCGKAQISSNAYFLSTEYNDILTKTSDFYKSLTPFVNNTFGPADINFKNAYAIWDLIDAASVHNLTFDPTNILNNETLFQARTLADIHEFNLAYNASDKIRAVAGSTLAAQVVSALNDTVHSASKPKFNLQLGNYATMESFFGLAGLPAVQSDFYGVPDFASTLVWELSTNAAPSPLPSPDQMNVRFFFHNGTTDRSSDPIAYPLFGTNQESLPWNTFVDKMNSISLGTQDAWCKACGNTTGSCAPQTASPTPASSSSTGGGGGGGGVSRGVAGVIGAMVTLAVVLGVEALIFLVAGLRLVSKRRLNAVSDNSSSASPSRKA